MVRSICVSLLVLFFAAPAAAEDPKKPSFWSINDRVEEVVVPGCEELCEHVLGLLRN